MGECYVGGGEKIKYEAAFYRGSATTVSCGFSSKTGSVEVFGRISDGSANYSISRNDASGTITKNMVYTGGNVGRGAITVTDNLDGTVTLSNIPVSVAFYDITIIKSLE